jgi:hypothetical protein
MVGERQEKSQFERGFRIECKTNQHQCIWFCKHQTCVVKREIIAVKGIQASSGAILDFCAEFYLTHKVVKIGFVHHSLRKIGNCSFLR